jgi:folate-binding protein YgfZ
MITDARVVNLADRTLLDVPASLAEGLRAKLDTLLFSEDARIEDASGETTVIDLHGPAAPDMMRRSEQLLPEDVAVVRDDVFYVPGFSLFAPASVADRTVSTLTARGAVETTLATLDVVRIEAGRPAFLIDMDDHTIPLEAGIEDRAISFTKGCYVGQEVIVRVMQRGQGRVAKKLVGLDLAGSDVPPAGSTIRVGDRDVGRVTSAAWSPRLEHGIALGYVHRDYVDLGTTVEIVTASSVVPAAIRALPFVSKDISETS